MVRIAARLTVRNVGSSRRMIKILKYVISVVAVMCAGITASAGMDIQRGNAPGIDPVRDSISMSEIRNYLSEIRKTRPTVALVLSGGGAKGAAHIGVAEYLDSLKIPVDVVLGTSMGGLIGGIYALGYSPRSMDSLIRTIDWSMALTDRVPRAYVPYAKTKYKEKVLLSFPFYYAKQDYMEMKETEEQYSGVAKKSSQLHLGADREDATGFVRENLLGSLPAGFAYGLNVSNIFSSLSVGYQDATNFLDLPVPFVCVATEMVSARPKVWYEGKINTAMRSTMSIPGVFAPVKTDGMVLVDGGMRDNYPADLAEEMGADIIIGVDLSSGFRDYSGLNNLGDIISQGVDMLGREAYEKNVNIPDVTIRPYLPEYNMMSFDAASIDVIIERGRQAAREVSGVLDSIRVLTGGAGTVLRNRKAIDINVEPVRISKIEITGVSDQESRYLMRKIRLDMTSKVSRADVEDVVAAIFGTGAFDYVTYELQGREEPFGLVFHCRKGPVHQFGVSGRFDTEESLSMLLNFGLNVHRLQGSALDFTGKIGINPYAQLHYYLKTVSWPTLNVAASFKWADKNQFSMLGESDFTVAYLNFAEEIYLSNIRWKKFDLKAGARSYYYKLNSVMFDKPISGEYDMDDYVNNYLSLFGHMRADTFDDGYFPDKGFTLGLGYEWVFKGIRHSINPFHAVTFDFKTAIPMTDWATLMPSVYARYLFGGDPAVPFVNLMGGSMRGRYLDQQIPFMGINYAVSTQNFLTVGRLDLRFRLFKNNYLTAVANYALSTADVEDITDTDKITGIFGAGLKYSYDSIIGPVEFDVHWASHQHRIGAYLNIGLYF